MKNKTLMFSTRALTNCPKAFLRDRVDTLNKMLEDLKDYKANLIKVAPERKHIGYIIKIYFEKKKQSI